MPEKKKQRHTAIRTCASCKWIFRWNAGEPDKGCPKCGFAHYSAVYVFGRAAYRLEKTQNPWKRDQLWRKLLELEKEIDESLTPEQKAFPKTRRLKGRNNLLLTEFSKLK